MRRTYRIGEMVRIKSGAFASFTGRIDGINQAKALLKVTIVIFGQERAIKLRFIDVEKLTFD